MCGKVNSAFKKKHHVGAGNAVKFGNSSAAVTGYETSSATQYDEAAILHGSQTKLGKARQ
jgi:hypothetical protein